MLEIIKSFYKDQRKQMVDQIEQFGWYEFALHLELNNYGLEQHEKLELALAAIRTKFFK